MALNFFTPFYFELKSQTSLEAELSKLDKDKNHLSAIYLDVLAPLTGNLTIGYERIGPNATGSIGLGIIGITEPVFDGKSQYKASREAQGYFIKIMAKIKSINYGKKGITSLGGIYVFPQVSLSNYTVNGKFFEWNNDSRVNVTSWSITFGLGWRKFIGKSRRLYFDTYLSILGYGGSNYVYSDYNFSHWVNVHEEVIGGNNFLGYTPPVSERKSGYAASAGLMVAWLPANNK